MYWVKYDRRWWKRKGSYKVVFKKEADRTIWHWPLDLLYFQKWKQKCLKCYWTKKRIEFFCIHPSMLWMTSLYYHRMIEHELLFLQTKLHQIMSTKLSTPIAYIKYRLVQGKQIAVWFTEAKIVCFTLKLKYFFINSTFTDYENTHNLFNIGINRDQYISFVDIIKLANLSKHSFLNGESKMT